jgi:hypothetical protein
LEQAAIATEIAPQQSPEQIEPAQVAEVTTKPSREVPVHVIKGGIRTTEKRQPTPKLLSELVSQKKIYTMLRNCLNS